MLSYRWNASGIAGMVYWDNGVHTISYDVKYDNSIIAFISDDETFELSEAICYLPANWHFT